MKYPYLFLTLGKKTDLDLCIEKLVELNVYRLFIGKTQNTQNTKLDIKKFIIGQYQQ